MQCGQLVMYGLVSWPPRTRQWRRARSGRCAVSSVDVTLAKSCTSPGAERPEVAAAIARTICGLWGMAPTVSDHGAEMLTFDVMHGAGTGAATTLRPCADATVRWATDVLMMGSAIYAAGRLCLVLPFSTGSEMSSTWMTVPDVADVFVGMARERAVRLRGYGGAAVTTLTLTVIAAVGYHVLVRNSMTRRGDVVSVR